MGQLKLVPPSNVVSLQVARVAKDDANCNGEAKAESYLPGATEPPLPLTPRHLDIIKAYLNGPLSTEKAVPATCMSVAPRARAAPPAAHRFAYTPLTSHLRALSSGFRAPTAALILVALIPNVTLGAILWFELTNTPASRSVALPPSEEAAPEMRLTIPPSVIATPTSLQAMAGERLSFPIAVGGSDGIPGGSSIAISGLPRGSTLSTGRPRGEAEWNVELGELGDLNLMLPRTAGGETKLSIQLRAPDGHVIADTATILKVTGGSEASIPIHRVKTQTIEGPVWAHKTGAAYEPGQEADAMDQPADASDETGQPGPDPHAMDAEGRPADPDATTSTSDLVPLPTRRPAPPESTASANADTNWVTPSAFVNLRREPASSAPVVTVIAKGAKLRVKGRKRGWVAVANPATSQEGWIYGGHVETVR